MKHVMSKTELGSLVKTLGPGILFASTAIGVSHLVQSTRAGAEYGFQLLAFIIAANLFKYPFFEYGSRYANSTGTSIIDGYNKLGKFFLWVYLLITVGTMFFVAAAVGFVTAAFFQNLFGMQAHPMIMTTILFVICLAVLMVGKYNLLDSIIKILAVVMLLTTLAAFFSALIWGDLKGSAEFWPKQLGQLEFPFLIALMGWMPTAVDLSAWNSLWTVERIKTTGYKPTLKQTLFDFNLGYWASAILSICFVTLGAFLMYGSGQDLHVGPATFAGKVIDMYVAQLGSATKWIIAPAAFTIMFGTAIAVFDGYGRALKSGVENAAGSLLPKGIKNKLYAVSLSVVGVGAYLIIWYFHDKPKGFTGLVDLATTISFLVAPAIAILNFVLVLKLPKADRPNTLMKILSILGILFLTSLSIFFLVK